MAKNSSFSENSNLFREIAENETIFCPMSLPSGSVYGYSVYNTNGAKVKTDWFVNRTVGELREEGIWEREFDWRFASSRTHDQVEGGMVIPMPISYRMDYELHPENPFLNR